MKGNPKTAEGGELDLTVAVSRLPDAGLPIRLEADAASREAVARRLGLVGIGRLVADLVASRWQGEGVLLVGALEADVVQTDVVTLDPLPQSVTEEVRLRFVPEHSRLAPAGFEPGAEVEVDPAAEEIETFNGDRIDLGEAIVQLLGVALDPYPRRSGVAFDGVQDGEPEPSPFAVLAKLRSGKD